MAERQPSKQRRLQAWIEAAARGCKGARRRSTAAAALAALTVLATSGAATGSTASPLSAGQASSPASSLAAAGEVTRTFTLSASSGAWVDTGIDIPAGGSARLAVSGNAKCGPGSDCPAGSPLGAGRTCANRSLGPLKPGAAPDVYYGAVGGRVGNGTPFMVGRGTTVKGPGVLYLVYEDCAGYYGDNSGAFAVAVTVPTSIVVNTTLDVEIDPKALSRKDPYCDVNVRAPTKCSLRAAIQLANKLGGSQTISFDIPGGGVPKIDVDFGSALPAITASVTIDGTTQHGGWVELAGPGKPKLNLDGIGLRAPDSSIRGLVVNGFRYAIIIGQGSTHDVIAGDRIGTDPSGEKAVPNVFGIQDEGAGAEIGGPEASTADRCGGDCNLVSGNSSYQIQVFGKGSRVQGDTVGADVSGRHLLPQGSGIFLGGSNVLIGGRSSAPGTAPGNVIGSGANGIDVTASATNATISGNLIGVQRSGKLSLFDPADSEKAFETLEPCPCGIQAAAANDLAIGGVADRDANVISGWEIGVYLDDEAPDNGAVIDHDRIGTDADGSSSIGNNIGVLGGHHYADSVPDADAKNLKLRGGAVLNSLISGNTVGVLRAEEVQGNRIGTNLDGTAAIPNTVGVYASTLVGGIRESGSTSCSFPCNLISGNSGHAVSVSQTIQGNFIGTNLQGTGAIPNATTNEGADWHYRAGAVSESGTIGGTSNALDGVCDQACNLISGNDGYAFSGRTWNGIQAGALTPFIVAMLTVGLVSLEPDPPKVSIEGNVIGRSSANKPLPNQFGGISVVDALKHSWHVGGDDGTGNVIADNRGPAVALTLKATNGINAAPDVEGNSIIGNTYGLDYPSGFKVTGKPVISSVDVKGGQLVVSGEATGFYSGKANLVRIDVFGSMVCSPTPQGETPLGRVNAGPFSAGWTLKGPRGKTAYKYITATATSSADGGTSKFSACFRTAG